MNAPNTSLLSHLPLDLRGERPLYAQLADGLRDLVAAHFGDGDLFFSEKTLTETLPVSQITIRRALRELAVEGILVPGRGRGTTIQKPAATRPPSSGDRRAVLAGPRSTAPTLGIFLPKPLLALSEHSTALMQEFQRQGEARGIEVRFHDTSDTTRLSQTFRAIAGHRDDEAFILHTPSDLTHLLYHALDNRGYRSVAMEGIGPDYPGDVVATDSAAAVRIGMDHLLGLGHRQIVLLVNEPASEYSVQDKILAFQSSIEEHGIASGCRVVPCDNRVGGSSYEAAYAHMREAASGQPTAPTAIFTVSDPGAWAAVKWCGRHGIRVPQDISVLGFENARSSQYMHPAISTVAHPHARLVEAALTVLWDKERSGRCHMLIPPTLIARESTAPALQPETVTAETFR